MLRSRIVSTILSNNALVEQVFEMVLDCPEVAAKARPGQFVNLYCRNKGRLLPRPISVCETDRDHGRVHLVYAILGKGTREFSSYLAGESVELMGPLGNGYPLEQGSGDSLIIGGGVGTPPMVELCKQLQGPKTIVVGFRSNPFLVDRLAQYGDVLITTDDGSVGYKGHVVQLLEEKQLTGTIYACGPTPMLRGVQAYAQKNNLKAYISLEERMGCGFGSCVGCAARIRADNEIGWTYKKVCKDGPVFDSREVVFL